MLTGATSDAKKDHVDRRNITVGARFTDEGLGVQLPDL
jgi:hypothetical protein